LRPRTIKSAAFNQAFDDSLVCFAQVHFQDKVCQRGKIPLLFPGGVPDGTELIIADCRGRVALRLLRTSFAAMCGMNRIAPAPRPGLPGRSGQTGSRRDRSLLLSPRLTVCPWPAVQRARRLPIPSCRPLVKISED
jgi:hypothetical protein